MLMGRFLLQIYIFPRHKQNICCFLFTFTYGLLFKIRYKYSGQCIFVNTDKLFIYIDCIMVSQY